MKYKLQDLIDMAHFQNLQDRLNEIYSFPSAIIDNDGNVLTATGWQDVCTKFHRKHQDCLQECLKSDQYILRHLHEANPAVSYRCPHGLVDNATPIIIDGIHYGNFFTGQFFLEKPDLESFQTQARKYGFDEAAYLEAVKQVPIWSQQQLNSYLFFIKGLIAIISESGLKRLREIETRERVEEGKEQRRIILHTAMDGFWLATPEGRLLEVNETYCSMSGYTEPELLTMRISDLEAGETADATARHMQKVITQGQDRFESRHRRKDGSEFNVEVSVQYRPTNGGRFVAFLRDITERKRTEDLLKTSEAKFRAIIDVSPVPMALNDEQQHIIYINPAFVATYGYAKEDIPTLTHWWQAAYPDPEYRRWVTEAWQVELVRVKRTGTAFSPIEVSVRCKNGTHKAVLASAASISDAFQGEHMVVLYDITQRKRAEAELREKEERYRTLFERAPEGIFLLSLEGKLISVNESFARMHGYGADEMLQMNLRDLDTPDTSKKIPERMARLLAGGALTFEVEHYHKDGHVVPLEVSASLIITGETTLMQCFHRDITERVRTEAALRLTRFSIEHAADALFWMTSDACIVDVNEAACRSLGYTREELLRLRVPDVDAHYNAALWPQHFAELRQRGSMTFESEQITKDGRLFAVEVVANYVEHGGEERNCAFVRDITARKQAEAVLESSLREKVALLNEVHHRVKNNLQVIASLLRLEAGRSEHPATKSVLREMKGRIMSMALLHESLYRSGTFAAVDLGAYLKELATQSFRASVVQLGSVRLQLDLASVQVEMDHALPCGLLVNELISNCLKHGFPASRSGEVRVELQPVDGSPQWRLRVSDTGVGLPVDFEAKRGKSLGLQLVSDLAIQIDGRLEVGPGPGAIFDVTFTPKHPMPNPSTPTP